MHKNAFRLNSKTSKNSYDWWWHSFVAKHAETGELRPFFIEYYVVNPGLWNGQMQLGQSEHNKANNIKPCYAMIKAGAWGENKVQINNFWGISDFKASREELNCTIAHNTLTETHLAGKVSVTESERKATPEMMSDAGSMEWNLEIQKNLSYDVGYGSSELFNSLGAFHMYWHVQGMMCKLKGEIILNGEKYIIEPETSFGYQDKNWGKDYTNPWIWLNCNNFYSTKTNKRVNAGLDLGGGCPRVFGIPLKRKILTAFYYEGELIEFNFSKFWKFSNQKFNSTEDENYIYWDVVSENSKYKIDIQFRCEKRKMILVNYENPQGQKNHNKLWNGGHAEGSLKIYRKSAGKFELIDELTGSYGGCEYGEY